MTAKTAPKNGSPQWTENSDWLWQLLADVLDDVAKQPTPPAVRRDQSQRIN